MGVPTENGNPDKWRGLSEKKSGNHGGVTKIHVETNRRLDSF